MLKNPACLLPEPNNLFYPPKRGDYVYFEGPPFDPTPGQKYSDASWAADASMFAYARYVDKRSNEVEFKEILRDAGFTTTETIGDCFVDNASTARGFFAANDKFAILAFRGTEKGNLNDFAADAQFVPMFERRLGGRSAGLVHEGFQEYLSSVWTRVSQLVRDYRSGHQNQEIRITGHSLGAALATLAFHQLQDTHASLYTFGCPRVGNQAFCADLMLASRTQVMYRIVDNGDVVTHIPLGPLFAVALPTDYVHPDCTILWIDQRHQVVQNPEHMPEDSKDMEELAFDFIKGEVGDPLPEPLADHSPVRYCHWISQRALQKVSTTAS